MNKTTTLYMLALVLTATLMIQACSPAPAPLTGNNSQGIALTPDPHDKSLLWWETPGFDWRRYHGILLAPVVLNLPDESMADLSPEDLDDFKDEVRAALINALSPEHPLVTEKGPGILGLRVTVTGLETANPVLNLATTLALFVPLDMGGASIEVTFFDTRTGTPVAAMADSKSGTPFQLRSGFSRLGHAKAALGEWAEELETALAENP